MRDAVSGTKTRRPGGPIWSRARCWAGAFDGAGERGAGGDAHLVEDVAQVGLDGLLAQEQFRGGLRVGLAVDDEPRHLEFASGQRLMPAPLALPGRIQPAQRPVASQAAASTSSPVNAGITRQVPWTIRSCGSHHLAGSRLSLPVPVTCREPTAVPMPCPRLARRAALGHSLRRGRR
jgi:hypothetical protein